MYLYIIIYYPFESQNFIYKAVFMAVLRLIRDLPFAADLQNQHS